MGTGKAYATIPVATSIDVEHGMEFRVTEDGQVTLK
jgi:hypothetical protein